METVKRDENDNIICAMCDTLLDMGDFDISTLEDDDIVLCNDCGKQVAYGSIN